MKVMNVCWSISEQFIDFRFVWTCRRYRLCFGSCARPRMGQPAAPMINEAAGVFQPFTAIATQYYAAGIGLKSRTCERVNEVASCSRIWPIVKTKKRGSRERSSPPCQIRTFILPRCPEARGNILI